MRIHDQNPHKTWRVNMHVSATERKRCGDVRDILVSCLCNAIVDAMPFSSRRIAPVRVRVLAACQRIWGEYMRL